MSAVGWARPEWIALVLLGPAVGLVASWLLRRRLRTAEAWAARGLWDRLLAGYSPRRARAAAVLLGLVVGALGLALARPRFGGAIETVERKGVDVVYVLDVSRSMAVQDVLPSRLAVGRATLRRLVEAMPGNRVGLVAAEGTGEVFSPLTTDAGVLDLVLDTLEPGALQVPGTVLAPALDRALELFPPGGDKHRAVVLVSDGEDHGGGLDGAAKRLAEAGVVVIALGIGTEAGGPVPDAGERDGVKRRPDGSLVVSRLEPVALAALAERTQGLYRPISDLAAPLTEVIDAIGRLERTSFESATVDTEAERFQWPLALAVLALAAYLALRPFGTAGRPEAPQHRRSAAAAVAALIHLIAAPLVVSQGDPPTAPKTPAVPWSERLQHNPRAQTGAALGELAATPDDPAATARAAEDLDSAARLAPQNPLAQFNAGTGRLLAGRPAEAEQALGRAAELGGEAGPGLGAALPFNLGNARFAQGNYQGALEAYRDALRLDPNLGDAKFNLELALRALTPPQPQPQPQKGPPPPAPAPNPPEPQDPEAGQPPPPRPSGEQPAQPDPTEPPPRPDFRDQPELDQQQARQLLQAVDQLEKKERRRQAAERRKKNPSPDAEKDW